MNEPKPWEVTCVSVRGTTAFQIEPAPASLEEVQAMRALIADAPALKAERDELREALRKIAFDPFGSPTASHAQVLDAITELARAVLERTKPK